MRPRMTGLGMALLGALFVLAAVPARADPAPSPPGVSATADTGKRVHAPPLLALACVGATVAVAGSGPVVRAKFKCNSVTKRSGFNGAEFVYDARFNPVTGGSDEDKKFYAATPGGEVNLVSILPDAFEVGQEYYLDFTPANPPEANG